MESTVNKAEFRMKIGAAIVMAMGMVVAVSLLGVQVSSAMNNMQTWDRVVTVKGLSERVAAMNLSLHFARSTTFMGDKTPMNKLINRSAVKFCPTNKSIGFKNLFLDI